MQKKILALLIIISSTLFAIEDADKQLYELQAKLFPQILTYDNELSQKMHNSNVIISIVYSKAYEDDAEFLKSKIQKIYQHTLKGMNLDVNLVAEESYRSIMGKTSGAVIIMGARNSRSVLSELTKSSVITFATSEDTLKNGALFAIRITDKTRIILNKKTFQSGRFSLSPALLKLVKPYEEEQ